MNHPEPITYTDGGRGTATLEYGKLGPQAGRVLVLRRGFPVAAELAAAVPESIVTPSLLSALGVGDGGAMIIADMLTTED